MKDKTLVGTYKLASWENRHASGDVTYPLGSDAVGYISYSNEGFVFVHIMARHRHLHSSGDLFGGEPGEIMDSATSHVSYCGTYQVDGDEVMHTVTVASFPNWIGSAQRRKFEFKDGKLLLSAEGLEVGSESVDAYLVWKRAEESLPG